YAAPPAVAVHLADPELDGESGAVAPNPNRLACPQARCERIGGAFLDEGGLGGLDQISDEPADCVIRRIAEHPLCDLVEDLDRTLAGHLDDRVEAVVDDLPHQLLGT